MTLLMGFSSWDDRVCINKYYNLFIIYIIIYIINKKYMNWNSEILMSEVEKWKSGKVSLLYLYSGTGCYLTIGNCC